MYIAIRTLFVSVSIVYVLTANFASVIRLNMTQCGYITFVTLWLKCRWQQLEALYWQKALEAFREKILNFCISSCTFVLYLLWKILTDREHFGNVVPPRSRYWTFVKTLIYGSESPNSYMIHTVNHFAIFLCVFLDSVNALSFTVNRIQGILISWNRNNSNGFERAKIWLTQHHRLSLIHLLMLMDPICLSKSHKVLLNALKKL